jgi:hypothetical protein
MKKLIPNTNKLNGEPPKKNKLVNLLSNGITLPSPNKNDRDYEMKKGFSDMYNTMMPLVNPLGGKGLSTVASGASKVLPVVGKYLTTKTPLKNAYKLNPLAFKPDPEAFYHRSPDIKNIINKEKGVLQGFGQSKIGKEFTEKALKPIEGINLRKGANSQLYFAKGVPLDYGRTNKIIDYKTGKLISGHGYPGPYIAEVKGVPMGASTNGKAPGVDVTNIGGYAVSRRPIAINEAKFYKEDWLKRYKLINK